MLHMVYKDVYLGGAETLLTRLGGYFIEKGIPVYLFCEHFYSEEIRSEFAEKGIIISQSACAVKATLNNCSSDDIILTVSLYDYINCLIEKQKKKVTTQVFYYVVHPFNSIHNTKSRVVNILTKKQYRRILMSSANDGHMFFMDELCTTEFSRFYKCTEMNCLKMIYLPMRIQKLNMPTVSKLIERRHTSFNILTVARAEFPFKGYIKTLIALYKELYKINNKCSLTIVSSGEEIEILKEWIAMAVKETKGVIDLVENVSPNELGQYYSKAGLYIGQGTTLLEACNYCIPVLPVEGYTYELKSNGFFNEVDGCLGVPFGTGENADQYILKALNMTDDEYRNLILACRKVFESKYDIEKFYNYMTDQYRENNHIGVPLIVRIENKIRTNIHDRNK